MIKTKLHTTENHSSDSASLEPTGDDPISGRCNDDVSIENESGVNETGSYQKGNDASIVENESEPDPKFQDCESVVVCLEGGRFAIVRYDETEILQSTESPVDDLRQLAVNQPVTYRGSTTRALAIEPYR